MLNVSKRTSIRFKALSIIFACLVVCIHIPHSQDVVSRWLIRLTDDSLSFIAVPFYFLCSGFFLAKDNGCEDFFKNALLKRVRTLIVPFLLFNFLWVVYLLHGHVLNWGTVYRMLTPFDYPWLRPTWFIRSLLFFVVLSPILLRFMRSICGCLLMLAIIYSLYLYYFIGVFAFDDPSGVVCDPRFIFYGGYFSLEGLFYFSLGCAMRLHGAILVPYVLKYRKRIVSISLVVLLLTIVYAAPYGDSLSRIVITPIGLTVVLLVDSQLNFAARWSFMAFPLYLLHGCFIGVVSRRISSCSIVCFVVVVIASFAVVLAGRRICPRVCNVIFGGRV